MNVTEVLNLAAIIIIPITAVLIGQYLQTLSEKRKDRMHIFKTLMASRIYAWTPESVYCLNTIDIVFAHDENVREAWKDLFDKYCIENPDEMQLKKIQNAKNKLLETIAVSLGYKDKITWETIQNPYMPKGMSEQIEKQNLFQERCNNMLLNIPQLPTLQNKKAEESGES